MFWEIHKKRCNEILHYQNFDTQFINKFVKLLLSGKKLSYQENGTIT